MTTPTEALAIVRATERAATEGPWVSVDRMGILADVNAPVAGRDRIAVTYGPTRFDSTLPEDDTRTTNPHTNFAEDAALIVLARNQLSAALDVVEAAAKVAKSIREWDMLMLDADGHGVACADAPWLLAQGVEIDKALDAWASTVGEAT